MLIDLWGFLGGSDSEESACKTWGLILGLGKSPGEGNGNSLQYSCLENSMDRGAWWATVHGVTKSPMKETRVLSLGWENPLEKEMATHSSILA